MCIHVAAINYMADTALLSEMTVDELVSFLDKKAQKFKGQINELESAIGMVFLGRNYGWKVVYLVHSRRTVNKYEKLLDIDVKTSFPETTKFSDRSLAYKIAKTLGNFWKATKGEYEGYDTTSPVLE